jgi:putative inorganic carbon (HCO3(-)) transporter
MNPYRQHSLKEIWDTDLYFCIAVFMIAVGREPARLNRWLKVFFWAGIVTAIWGLIQWGVKGLQHAASGPPFLPPELAELKRRIAGTRNHPLMYAETLLFIWGYGLSALLKDPGKQTWKYLAALLLVEGALLGSLSRGPWLAAAAMGGVALAWCRDGAALRRLGLLAVPLLPLLMVPSIGHRAQSIVSTHHVSNADRLEMWHAGWKMWKENPWFGLGPGNVKIFSTFYQRPQDRRYGPWGHLHSTYINVAAERGILGLLGFLVLMGTLAWELLRSPSDPLVRRTALLGMVGFLVSGMTETVYNNATIMMIFYFVVGIGLACVRNREGRNA